TCLFGAAHAAAAGLPALISHPRVHIDDIEVSTDRPEGRLLLLDLLLEQLIAPAEIRQLAVSPSLRDLEPRAVDKLIARRLRTLHHTSAVSTPHPPQQACEVVSTEIASSDGQLDALLAAIQPHLGAEVLLADQDFRPLAWHPEANAPASLASLITSKRLNRLVEQLRPGVAERVRLGTPSAGHRLVMRIGSQSTLGYLSVTAPDRDEATTTHWLRHAAPALATALAQHAADQQLRTETRHQLVTMLANGMLSPRSAQLAVTELAGSFSTRIIALSCTEPSTPDQLARRLRSLRLPHGDHQGLAIALIDDTPETASQLLKNLRPLAIRLGLGSSVTDATELPVSARQAVWACRIALATHHPMVDFAGIGVHRLLLPGAEGGDPEFEEPIRRLEQAADLGFDGLHTLVGYLDAGGNMRRAAHDLAVHPNTLRYRTQRIAQIIEVNLADPEQRFRLQLAARLRAGRRAMHEQL
ncbi:MAG TPA: helix-turn-helix domain-containing protein, partial [Pseudonocardia sp.]